MDKYYQINLPSGMAPVHPEPSHSVIPSLAASHADRVFISGTFINDIFFNAQYMNALNTFSKDIFPINNIKNQKKEVDGVNMKLQHCKYFQYDKKLLSGSKIFNN